MQEVAVGEIHRNKVEIGGNNILKTIVFNEINKIGSRYYQKNPRKERNFGDWEVKNDKGQEKRKLKISKGKEKQHLTINFDKKQMTGFDFMLSDGKTIVSLQKNREGKFLISRKDKDGKLISDSENLTARDYLELRNFPFKFSLDRNVNAIVDTVDPDEIIRYVTPVALTIGFAGHAAFSNVKTPNVVSTYLGSRPVLQVSPIKNPTTGSSKGIAPPAEIKADVNKFENNLKLLDPPEDRNTFYTEAMNNTKVQGMSSNIQELELVDQLISDYGRSDGLQTEIKMRKYFESIKSNGLYHYRADSRGNSLTLVKPLEDALKIIRSNPKSQRSIFALLDGLHSYHTAGISDQQLITPERIILQAGYSGPIENISAQQIWDKFWSVKAENYNRGSIKGFNLMFETVANGDLFVYPKGEVIGMVMNVDIKNGITVWTYNQSTGKVKIIKYNAKDFPNEEVLGFRR